MRTGSFPGVKSGRSATLTPHPVLVPWSRKGRAIPLLPLWAVRPVQSLSANYPDAGYPHRLGLSGRFVQNSIKLTYLEITGYRIKYSTVLWLLGPQIMRGRKV